LWRCCRHSDVAQARYETKQEENAYVCYPKTSYRCSRGSCCSSDNARGVVPLFRVRVPGHGPFPKGDCKITCRYARAAATCVSCSNSLDDGDDDDDVSVHSSPSRTAVYTNTEYVYIYIITCSRRPRVVDLRRHCPSPHRLPPSPCTGARTHSPLAPPRVFIAREARTTAAAASVPYRRGTLRKYVRSSCCRRRRRRHDVRGEVRVCVCAYAAKELRNYVTYLRARRVHVVARLARERFRPDENFSTRRRQPNLTGRFTLLIAAARRYNTAFNT